MKTNQFVISFLLGTISAVEFGSDIPMAESVATSNEYDMNAKTIKLDIKKTKDYKEMVTDSILKSHLSVSE